MTTLNLSDEQYRAVFSAVNFRALYLSKWLNERPEPNLPFLYDELAGCREVLRTVFGMSEELLPAAVAVPVPEEAIVGLAEVSE